MPEPHPQSGARVLALIACRSLALYVLFNAVVFLGSSGVYAVQMFIEAENPTVATVARSLMMGLGVQGITYFLGCAVLWFAAPWLARKIIPAPLDDTLSFNVTATELAALTVSAVGLFALAKGVWPLVGLAMKSATRPIELFATDGVLAIAYLGLGALLLANRHRLAAFLIARR